ncbi:MAG: hypothetical protein LBV68_01310, partial [Spirochaetaceae bacterium]|nr:hypothetical protein [Spirochaetaceae bacterium]
KYLVKVSSPEVLEEGNFTEGLIGAGVPMATDIIWAPNREISNTAQTDVDPIKDKLWIATEWEMWGVGIKSNTTFENQSNQAILEYYLEEGGDTRKYLPTGTVIDAWLASPAAGDSSRCCILRVGYGAEVTITRNSVGGIAPAFCVR